MIQNPILSIIIVNFNTLKITANCIQSIRADKQLKNGDFPYEIILVDNGSTDGSLAFFAKDKKLKLISSPQNLGFAQGNNLGIQKAKGQYLLFLNSDTLIKNSAISQCLIWLSTHPEAGSCTGQLLNPDNSIQATGGYFPNLLNLISWRLHLDDLPFYNSFVKPLHPHPPSFYTKDNFYKSPKPLDWLTGAFILIRKNLIDHVTGFDSKYFMYAEELEMFYRLKQAFPKLTNWYLTDPKVIHFGGTSNSNPKAKYELEKKGLLYFFQKHHPKLAWLVNLFL